MSSEPLRRLLGFARRAVDPTDDAGLLARFAASTDADAFELLVWRHGGMVLGVCRRILGDDHAAEDAFQATFLALARRSGSVRRGGCVAAWLHRVARRVALRAKYGERRAVRPTWLGPFENSEQVGLTARRSPVDDPLAAAANSELTQILDEELDRLPERLRRPVVLCYLEGRSTAEAAERLGCPRGTVLSRLAAARTKLKTRLLRRGVAPAILPPVIYGGLSDAPAALIGPTVRAVLAHTAAPRVIDLCDGVLRAMILSKLKLATVVVLMAGILGGGAGWVALTPGGPGMALAGPHAKPVAPRPNPEQKPAEALAEQRQEEISKLRVELANAQEQLTMQEEAWAHERIDARAGLALEERQYTRIKDNPPYQRGSVSNELATAQSLVQQLRIQLQLKNPPPDLQEKLKSAEEYLRVAQALYDKEWADYSDSILRAHLKMLKAEERLLVLDRLTAVKRRGAQAQVEDYQDRLIQLRGGTARSDPAERKINALEHKLDDVLHELAELRRELRK